MQKKYLIFGVGLFILAAIGGFWAGMKYQQSKLGFGQNPANMTAEQRQQLFQRNGNASRRNGQNAAGFTNGEVISKDDKSITIKLPDGGSKIIFYSNETLIGKTTDGAASDLEIGKQVTVSGTTNSDGSIAAKNIQLRPNQTAPAEN